MQYAHFTFVTEGNKRTLLEYVIVFAFSLQHWWHEPASEFHYTYIDCLVTFNEEKGCRLNFCLSIAYITLPKGL